MIFLLNVSEEYIILYKNGLRFRHSIAFIMMGEAIIVMLSRESLGREVQETA
jgi:hypothetical protein